MFAKSAPKLFSALPGVFWIFALNGLCGEEPNAEAKAAPLNVGGIDSKNGATVTGIVKFSGDKPERNPIQQVTVTAFCAAQHKDALPLSEDCVCGRNGDDDTLQNVLVYVSKGLEGKKFDVPAEAVVLDQHRCMYAPHVVAAMAGQKVEIRNSDDTLHNVMSSSVENKNFNVGMPFKGDKLPRVFDAAEFKVTLKCALHPWMTAYLHVLEHPFFAVTQADGSFTLKGLPPGEYQISVLHETASLEARPSVQTLKLGAGEMRKIEFVYKKK